MRIAALSLRALHLAAQLPDGDGVRIGRWLYRYGTLPSTPEAERDFGPEDDPMVILGLTRGGRARRRLAERYEGATYPGWLSFTHNAAPPEPHAGFKLYVSPRPEALAGAFPILADRFAALDVRAFKVGRSLDGLLRPDKIVAYFDTRAHLDIVAAAVAKALAGCPAQGVPFTATWPGKGWDADGLLSHGVDPPPGSAASSWRAWVTRRLADALVAARPATGAAAVEAVLRAAAAGGIDTTRWTADAAFLPRASA